MTLYQLPLPPKVLDYLTAHPIDADLGLVGRRVEAYLTKMGYTVTSGSVGIDGLNSRVVVDADRDPNADIAAVDPTIKTDAEKAEDQLTSRLEAAITLLQGGGAMTPAQTREFQIATLKALVSLRKGRALGGP